MRKVIVGAFVSLDGVMQAPGGPSEDPTKGFAHGGWVVPYVDETFGAEVDKLFGQPFALLLGRKTYEIFAAHWPYAEGGQDDGIAKAFKTATKYVASRKGVDLTWEGSVALSDAAADVAKLKQEDGPPLVTQGSSDMLQSLFAADLADELHVFTIPVLLGGGKKLFESGAAPRAFTLSHQVTSASGISICTYQRAGAIGTGDFGLHPPTAAELARQEKMRREG